MLSTRQGQVLQAVVSSWVGGAAPVSSDTVAAVLPVRLSPQSVRNTLAELAKLGLVEKAHHSAGRVPTERGMRVFVDEVLSPVELGPFEKRDLEGALAAGGNPGLAERATQVLSERTRQLGFLRPPRLEHLRLRHISFIRVSSERVMAILVSATGRTYQRVLEEPGSDDQVVLDRMASSLNEHLAGSTLRHAHARLSREAGVLREAAALLARVLQSRGETAAEDLVLGTRVVLLDQPEFHDPERLRELLRAVEEKERLVSLVDQFAMGAGVRIAFGTDVSDPSLRDCAVVVATYGPSESPVGALGVIGPSRMDFARVVPLVGYVSRMMTRMLPA